MYNDYSIYCTNLDRAQVGYSRGCRREPNYYQHCSCHQHRPHPPYPPFPPFPPFPPAELAIRLRKLDACSNTPLAGATFELTRDGLVIGSATSAASGEVIFNGLMPGKYLLRETVTPPNYRQDLSVYEVELYPNGAIAVDGDFTRNFVVRNYLLDESQLPVVNPITVDSESASGTGGTGCMITVTWPDGEISATTVNGGGTWAVSKPDLLVLAAGDLVRVTQTCPQHLESEPVYVGVGL